MGFKDMRSYLEHLENKGLLKHVRKEIDRDWELSAVCRNYFYSTSLGNRCGLMFDHVKGFNMPVVAGIVGASRRVYAEALGVPPTEMLTAVGKKWAKAIANPIPPVEVKGGPVKEVAKTGQDIDLFSFPHPFWTVDHDPGYFLTAPCIISKNLRTGKRNVGTYRCQIKQKDVTGLMLAGNYRHLQQHLDIANELNTPLPVAIVLGAEPTIPLTSVSSIPASVDELAVCGALNGEPVEMVKCETIDLEVPAHAEIVIEGEIPPNYTEEEGPFGEYTGYLSGTGPKPVIRVKCITHRKNPIYQSFISQMPPSESSCIRSFGRESSIYSHLRDRLNLPVKDVHFTESSGAAGYLLISVDKIYSGQFWQYVWGAWSLEPALGKWTIVVDSDIDIRDPFQVEWALSFRTRPKQDVYIIDNTIAVPLDPAVPRAKGQFGKLLSSKVAVDATKKFDYPPVALPPAEHLARVKSNWAEYGLI
jgi:UbiD family decarboxylase